MNFCAIHLPPPPREMRAPLCHDAVSTPSVPIVQKTTAVPRRGWMWRPGGLSEVGRRDESEKRRGQVKEEEVRVRRKAGKDLGMQGGKGQGDKEAGKAVGERG